MVGRTTSVWGRSAKPTEPWSNIRAGGFASGCVSNTKSGPGGIRGFPESLASEVWLGSPYCADRQLSVGDGVNLFSESWMR